MTPYAKSFETSMKKRYGLDSIIGKNSSLRFPRHVYTISPITINAILASNTEEIEQLLIQL